MKLLLLLVLLGCLSTGWAHWREYKAERRADDNSESESDESEGKPDDGEAEPETEDEDSREARKREWWNKVLKNKTEPMLRLINDSYHKMLALPPPDKDESTNNWMERTKLVKEFVHTGKSILFGDLHHHHHDHHHDHHGHWHHMMHHHGVGSSDGMDWYMVGELVAGILNRLDEKDDMMKGFGMITGEKLSADNMNGKTMFPFMQRLNKMGKSKGGFPGMGGLPVMGGLPGMGGMGMPGMGGTHGGMSSTGGAPGGTHGKGGRGGMGGMGHLHRNHKESHQNDDHHHHGRKHKFRRGYQ